MNIKLILASAAALLAGCASSPQGHATEGLARIEHIVVIYAENRSFDHLYGFFPGADGIASATPEQKAQLDHDGNPLPHLPPVYDGGKPSPEFPQGLPNGPFRIDAPPVNRRMDEVLPSPIHGYFDGSKMKLWKWAQEYTLADHFFMAAFGGSYLNHQWLVCACTPMDTGAPASVKPQLDEKGNLKKKPISPASVMQGPVEVFDGRVTPDGYTVNTSQPPYQPSGIPPAAGASLDLADTARHPEGLKAFLADIEKGTLPQVAFYKPTGRLNQHPSYTDLASGDEHLADVLERLRKSPQWAKMAVIITYDENGGYWDHVPPPSGPGWGERWGPGTRVPAIIVSPFAKRGYVDKTPYDTTSVIKFITRRFELEPLPGVRANMGDLANGFDLGAH